MIREWFEQLAPRERLLVVTAGVLVVFTVIMLLGIRPLFSHAERAGQRVADKQSLLQELDRLAARLGPGSGRTAAPSGDTEESLVVLVDRTTRAANLAAYVKRNQPDGPTSIRLRFENAPFDALVGWLTDMKNRHGMTTMSASIDRSQEPGRVNCNLVLTRSGG